ncbi:hypothetical protein L6Q21_13510 [Sandaracinobacter sp. RS1-74]|uniref:hypothetical protein n=1 Tax=Sandaracinobacteroides sayramensis TaxID=2913411 RepID=UPI001EDBE7DC|nr:hypothetical protein [Sandaracinobacteroides sayramensis]MCG2842000.1 hypothetical protein [Sandaracinobacteroides sayramensis]
MIQTAGYVLLITDSSRADELAAYADDDMEFAESVPSFSVPSRDRLLALLSLSPGFITHVSRAKRGRTSATSRRQLNLMRTVALNAPIAIEELLGLFPVALLDRLRSVFEDGGLITVKQWAVVQDILVNAFDEVRDAIERLVPYRERVIDEMSATERETMALEHEAVAAALRLAGFDEGEREASLAWNPSERARTASFLNGLNAVPLREDTMIRSFRDSSGSTRPSSGPCASRMTTHGSSSCTPIISGSRRRSGSTSSTIITASILLSASSTRRWSRNIPERCSAFPRTISPRKSRGWIPR